MATFKDMLDIGLDIGSIGMELKNWSAFSSLARGGLSSFMGKKPAGTEGHAAPTEVAENAMQAGELQSLLGYLSAVHSKDGKKVTEYQVATKDRDLYPAIVKAMKPGARKLLMQTLGVQTIPVRKRRVVGYTEHEVNGKVVRSPETEETTEVVNLAGPQITSALTWFALQGGGTQEARVKRVVEMLETFGIFQSKKDALKELGLKSSEEIKRFMGWLDTHAQVTIALLTLGPKQLQDFLDRPECDQALADIEAEDDLDQKRILQEAFQGLLVTESERINTDRKVEYDAFARKGWALIAKIAILVVVITGLAKCS
jgi:hypothetical protein